MAGVRYEMSITSTFNGLRLQMLTSSVVEIDSCQYTKRVSLFKFGEQTSGGIFTSPRTHRSATGHTVHRENGGYGDSEHFFQSSSVLPSLKLPRNFLPVLSGFEKFLFLT